MYFQGNPMQMQQGFGNGYQAKGGGKGFDHMGNGYGQGNWGLAPGKGGMYAIPELIRTGSGFSYRGDEKVKLIVDAPIGEALMTGRADVEFLPIEHMKRLREVLPLIPLQAPEEEWNTWKGLASQGGKVFPGKSVDDLGMMSGMPINKKKTVESVATEMRDMFTAQQTAQTQQISELTTQIGTLATALQAQATATNQDGTAAPKRKVRKPR